MSGMDLRQMIFPYGMEKDHAGNWVFFNRGYKPVGDGSSDFVSWDDPKHRVKIKGLGPAKLKQLDHDGIGEGNRIYFYDDATNPAQGGKHLESYLSKLEILMKLTASSVG